MASIEIMLLLRYLEYLNLDPPDPTGRMSAFVGFAPPESVRSPPAVDSEGGLALRAIALYASFRTHAAIRHHAPQEGAADLFESFLRQATRSHAASGALVRLAHKRTRLDGGSDTPSSGQGQ